MEKWRGTDEVESHLDNGRSLGGMFIKCSNAFSLSWKICFQRLVNIYLTTGMCSLGGPVFQKCSFIFCPIILINRYTPKTDIPSVSNNLETFLTLLPLAENLILAHFCHFKGFWGPY